MLKLAVAVILVSVMLVVAGAAYGVVNDTKPPEQSIGVTHYHIELVPYHGHTLTCLVKVVKGGSGNSANDWGGPSCDWPEFHHENGWDKDR
jgi:hypothetical protein